MKNEINAQDLQDAVDIAQMITGFKCESSTSQINSIVYCDIRFCTDINVNKEKEIEIEAFDRYLVRNYSKENGFFHFESPLKALSTIIRAWLMWKDHLPTDIKNEYLENARKTYDSINNN
ncbi:hypothetical protein [Flavobacterium pectinovorum]|uniref:Uncharacterized protein n=1 Tax=Flavobacterium pectinovorum TaxID=29533 RepID=A0A502EMR8_9FLAO|nr:hypothetical protein [Flavobacterium pectinovorum]TPG37561.1 hypothetical protein EAH81_18905 [Flavobacterium pectinovorum]